MSGPRGGRAATPGRRAHALLQRRPGTGSKQATLKVVDQAVSSLSNLTAALLAARFLSPEDFGAFAIVVATCFVVIGFGRAVGGEPLLLIGDTSRTGPSAGAVLTSSAVGLLAAVAAGCLGVWVVGGPLGVGLSTISAFLPLLVLQDALRFAAFLRGRAGQAVVSDGSWLVVSAACMVVVGLQRPSLPLLIAAWAAPGALAGCVMLWGYRHRVAWSAVPAWCTRSRALAVPLLGEYLLVAVSQQGLLYIVSAVEGLTGSGAVRGAQVLLGPINVLVMGVSLSLVPMMREARGRGWPDLVAACRRTSAVLAGVVVVPALAVVALGPWVGDSLLGPVWVQAAPLLPYLALSMVVAAADIGAVTGLRLLEAGRVALAVRGAVVLALLGAITAGAVTAGSSGAVLGQAVVACLGLGVWWTAFLRSRRRWHR